jgi:phosphopantothenoylcysteine decarboxylase/phosphopantothenate--cysteine ligase
MKILITAGPTRERIDPVRYLSNDSSGKQGYALAQACAANGWDVTLVSGPTALNYPDGVEIVAVESALEMHHACMDLVEAHMIDVAICTAAVSDWRPKTASPQKIKKQQNVDETTFICVKNPDILYDIAHNTNRPKLVIGFAAETENLLDNAKKKLTSKGCDWIIANKVGHEGGAFGSDDNQATLISGDTVTAFDMMSKKALAQQIVGLIRRFF